MSLYANDKLLKDDLKLLQKLHAYYVKSGSLRQWSDVEKESIKNSITYHSNKMEGLQMNYGETLSFLTKKIIKPGVRAKDISNLENHQAILDTIFKTYESFEITTDNIKALHRELMKDPTQWDVIDALQAGPGEYKTENNYVFRKGGDHVYLDYTQVKEAMEKVVGYINKNFSPKQPLQSLEATAKVHSNFLQIHPFTDGNGRVARLLSTLMLLKLGFPPLVIEHNEREKYFNALIESESFDHREPIVHFFVKKMIIALDQRIKKKK